MHIQGSCLRFSLDPCLATPETGQRSGIGGIHLRTYSKDLRAFEAEESDTRDSGLLLAQNRVHGMEATDPTYNSGWLEVARDTARHFGNLTPSARRSCVNFGTKMARSLIFLNFGPPLRNIHKTGCAP